MAISCRKSIWKIRLQRAETESMTILDVQKISTNEIIFTLFSVTGRIYQIHHTSEQISCSCPYFHQHKEEWCKHILFLLRKFFKIEILPTQTEKQLMIETKIILSKLITKIDDLLSTTETKQLLADDQIRTKYQQIQTKNIRENKFCTICFEDLEPIKKDICPLVECPTCHNILHRSCIIRWFNQREHTCPYCRSIWNLSKEHIEEILGVEYLKIT